MGWMNWWREFLGFSPDSRAYALKVLTERYIHESQHMLRLRQHAPLMPYPHFRQKLLAIAADEERHVQWIAEKILLLGGKVPEVPPVAESHKTSWQSLKEDLNEEQRCADELAQQANSLRGELPAVADVLERIVEDGAKHRAVLRELLMRSDPQSRLSYLA